MSFLGGMPFPVQFFLAFVVVLGLIGVTAWTVRRFGSGRLTGVGLRGRQPRLAVVDYASVDARRRLILVRRDNVEHLMMIGGPTDIVVEPNIVRAAAPARDIPVPRPPGGAEALPRAIPMPEAAGSAAWMPGEASAPPAGPPRAPRADIATGESAAFPLQPNAEATPRPQRETLAALAEELSPRTASARNRPAPPQRPQAAEPRQDPVQESKQEPRPAESRSEPRSPGPAGGDAALAPTADQSLAEMAHRLEAALRRPSARADQGDAREPRAAASGEETAATETAPAVEAPSPPPRASRAPEIKASRADPKHSAPGKALYDSLEQEMASLLGRPAAKH